MPTAIHHRPICMAFGETLKEAGVLWHVPAVDGII